MSTCTREKQSVNYYRKKQSVFFFMSSHLFTFLFYFVLVIQIFFEVDNGKAIARTR